MISKTPPKGRKTPGIGQGPQGQRLPLKYGVALLEAFLPLLEDHAQGELFRVKDELHGLDPRPRPLLQAEGVLLVPGEGVDPVPRGAGMEHVHQGKPLVFDGTGDDLGGVVGVAGEGLGHEPAAQGQRQGQRPQGLGNDPEGLDLGHKTQGARGGGLALGEAVDAVVMHDQGDIEVAADVVEEVVPALPVDIPVAGFGDHNEGLIGDLYPGRRGQGPPVQAIEAVHPHVVDDLRGLADPGDEHHPMVGDPKLGQRCGQRLPDGEVPAAGAPGHGHFREILLGSCHRETSFAIHAGVKGRPSYFPTTRPTR